MQLTLDPAGAVEYREAPDDELPLKFKLTAGESETVFGLADKLGHFKNPLESPLKVAFMGKKTFRWENGSEKAEQQFNYSEDLSAQQLLDWFERMAESAQHRIDLERAAKYDRLGVDKVLRQLFAAIDRKRLVGLDSTCRCSTASRTTSPTCTRRGPRRRRWRRSSGRQSRSR